MNTTKVLLADADEDFRNLLAQTLSEESDLEIVGSVSSGEDALQILAAGSVDVLIMDLVLGGVDGLELLHRMGGLTGHRPSVLVISGFTRGNVVNQAAAMGADFFLIKPCHVDSVADRIRLLRVGVLDSNSLRQNLETHVTAIIHEIGVPADRLQLLQRER